MKIDTIQKTTVTTVYCHTMPKNSNHDLPKEPNYSKLQKCKTNRPLLLFPKTIQKEAHFYPKKPQKPDKNLLFR